MNYQDFWSHLPEGVRTTFMNSSTPHNYKRGEFIYNQGDSPAGIYFVEKGLVGLTRFGISGKEHLLRFFRAGQFFGHRSLFSHEKYHGTTISIEPTTIRLVPKDIVLDTLQKHPEILFEVVEVLSKELRRCENMHTMIIDHQIHVRVAQAIIFLKDLYPDHNWTRQEIANYCASTVSTVIKALTQLEQLGYIAQKGRSIIITNREKLISLQDEA